MVTGHFGHETLRHQCFGTGSRKSRDTSDPGEFRRDTAAPVIRLKLGAEVSGSLLTHAALVRDVEDWKRWSWLCLCWLRHCIPLLSCVLCTRHSRPLITHLHGSASDDGLNQAVEPAGERLSTRNNRQRAYPAGDSSGHSAATTEALTKLTTRCSRGCAQLFKSNEISATSTLMSLCVMRL